MSAPATGDVALFPLHTVLFPGGRLALRLFEQRYLAMARECMRMDRPFGVCRIREGAEVGAPATPEPVGCLARIVEWDMAQLGVLSVVAAGEHRFRSLERRIESDGLTRATIERLPEVVDAELPPACAPCTRLLERLLAQAGAPRFDAPRYDSCDWVSARLAELLPIATGFKQRLLEFDHAHARLEALSEALAAAGVFSAR